MVDSESLKNEPRKTERIRDRDQGRQSMSRRLSLKSHVGFCASERKTHFALIGQLAARFPVKHPFHIFQLYMLSYILWPSGGMNFYYVATPKAI